MHHHTTPSAQPATVPTLPKILSLATFLALTLALFLLALPPSSTHAQAAPGEEWGQVNPLFTGLNISAVTNSSSLYVAVEGGTILTSPNGVSWTERASGTTRGLRGITWSGSQFVAVGVDGTILTSPDGRTWTEQASGTTKLLSAITWSCSQFVAVGGDLYTSLILTSPDGVSWTARTTGPTSWLNSVVWASSQFVAVGGGCGPTSS